MRIPEQRNYTAGEARNCPRFILNFLSVDKKHYLRFFFRNHSWFYVLNVITVYIICDDAKHWHWCSYYVSKKVYWPEHGGDYAATEIGTPFPITRRYRLYWLGLWLSSVSLDEWLRFQIITNALSIIIFQLHSTLYNICAPCSDIRMRQSFLRHHNLTLRIEIIPVSF